MKKLMCLVVMMADALCAQQQPLNLNGSWEFAFAEGKTLETAGGADFAATDRMSVPGCWDMLPKWLCKRGTGLYRRTFTLAEPVENAWIVVDGMGLRARFAVDGKPAGGVSVVADEASYAVDPVTLVIDASAFDPDRRGRRQTLLTCAADSTTSLQRLADNLTFVNTPARKRGQVFVEDNGTKLVYKGIGGGTTIVVQ